MTRILTHKRIRVTLIAALVFSTILLFQLVTGPKPGSIKYHYDRLFFLRSNDALWKKPNSAREYFRIAAVRRYLAGNPTLTQYMDRQEEDQLALIRLGYFERRGFVLSTPFSPNTFNQFLSCASNSPIDPNWFVTIDDSRSNWIRVTCRKDDMPAVRRILEQLDLKPTR